MSSLIGPRGFVTMDGNEAAAYVAHRLSEVIAIYPITPSSTMGELADQWRTEHQSNIWGSVPRVIEIHSEGGAVAKFAYAEARYRQISTWRRWKWSLVP
jgi:pyruvate/2-oxoacid:ferredoxin oxidoreductase alpha subunit